MKGSRNIATAIQAKMQQLIKSGMTPEQAARTIAEENVRRYCDDLGAAKARNRSRRYR